MKIWGHVFFVFFLCVPAIAGAQDSSAVPLERPGVVTLKGKPVTLLGPEIKTGDPAPDFTVQANDFSDVRLSDFKGTVKLIASVPSVDTPVCDLEIRRFNEEAVKMDRNVQVLIVSMDLPFAQKRFCGSAGIQNVKTYSDHSLAEFGLKYGVLIKDLRLLSRAIFIVDEKDIVRYIEIVPENGTPPDYDSALKTLRELTASSRADN